MFENLGNIGGHEPFIVFKNKAILPEGKKRRKKRPGTVVSLVPLASIS